MKNNRFRTGAKRLFIIALSCITLCSISACSTIEFVQYEQSGKHKTINRWHHSTLNGTVELSPPLNIKKLCKEKAWTTVTTELTPYNALAIALFSSNTLISLYSAWTNKVQCYQTSHE